MSLRPMTTARAPAIGIVRSLQQLDDSRRGAGDQRLPILDQASNVDRVKPVHVLVGRERIEDAAFGVGSHGLWQRRLHEDAVVSIASIQAIDDAQELLDRCRRRQSLEVRPQSGFGGRFQLGGDVERGCGVGADEDEAEPGRPPGARRERLHHRADLGANGIGDRDTIQQPGGHYEAASPSSCFSESGRPRTTSWSPERMGVVGSGLNSIRWSPRWMATTMTPNRCRRLASRID